MGTPVLIDISSTLLLIAFLLYIVATICFVVTITGKKWSVEQGENPKKKWGKIGFLTTLVGFGCHLGFFFLRWIGQGHTPTSNMFEFMSVLSLTVILGFIIIHAIYRVASLGAFVLPVTVTLIGWASVFDTNPKPLIPALQSHWLTLHVTTVSIGEGIFAVGFAAGLMYVLRTVDQKKSSAQTFALEFFLFTVLILVGFIILSFLFSAIGYEVSFEYINERGEEQTITYTLPAIAGPHEGEQITAERMQPIISTPSWMQGVDAPRKFNTMIWSVLGGLVLYVGLRLLIRKRLGAAMQPWVMELKPSMLDEISYRAIAIAFPIFTLGGLIFAMIWAEQAWGRFWGWDPKEVWALITWLFYATYLHLRLSRGWHGAKSAWLAVIGFIIIMFNLVFVNLVIAGLHSYA